MYKGSCLCGQVQFTITGKISDIIHCHCSLCRKSSGTAFATNGFVQKSDLKFQQGEDLLKYYELRPGKKRHFCQTCASPIFSSNDQDLTRIRIRLGIIDSDVSEKPVSHNFITSKANWDDLDADIPRYQRHEPSRDIT